MKKLQINWLLWIQGLLFVAAAVMVFNAVMNIDVIFSSISWFLGIVSPIMMAAVIAYMLSRPCKWVEKWIRRAKYPLIQKRARGLAVLCVYLVVIWMIYAILSFLFPLLIDNVMDFIDFAPSLYTAIEDFVTDMTEWDVLDDVVYIREAVDAFFAEFDVQTVVGHVTQGLGVVTNVAISTAFWLFDLILALIISIYMLLYKDVVFATIGRIVSLMMKTENMQTLRYYIKQADDLFYKFIGAQFLDACIMGAGSILLLWGFGVRFAVFLGIFLGVANMIPKFGSIIASLIVIGLTFITGGMNQGILIAILLTIWQQIDGNLIGPLIMGDALKINPILVFFSLLIGAQFGILGMFLSIPVMTLVKIIILNIVEAKEKMTQHSVQVASKMGQEKMAIKSKYRFKMKAQKPDSH
ncbi:MAG: AI-2E family transporter [Defluviitaleaceae bacterium]|nr:AI-2E family transporter [Defluviitaleaceae bacterium]